MDGRQVTHATNAADVGAVMEALMPKL
jgi:hypothetical protein